MSQNQFTVGYFSQEGIQKPEEVKRSVYRNLTISMIGFGVLVGLVFPPFAWVVLGTPQAMTPKFFLLCIFAGFLVGLVNNILFRKIVSKELKQIIFEMNSFLTVIHRTESLEEFLPHQLQVTSSDTIGRIQSTFNHLINEVIHRTRALEASVKVSRRLSSILDIQTLLMAVVEEVQAAFHLYHAQIYLYDEVSEKLVIRGGTGNAGQMLLERNYSVDIGKGLVGQAAESKKVVFAPVTAMNPNWLSNPFLPETKSEVAIPIAVSDRLIGVLDVQQNRENGITGNEIDLLHSIANQVAVAIDNANQFKQAQQRAERETMINQINQKIQSALTIDDVLRITAHELGAALDLNQVTVKVDNKLIL